MKIKIIYLFFLLLSAPVLVFARTDSLSSDIPRDTFFKAEVIKIIEQKKNVLPDGSEVWQQNLLLRGLENPFWGREVRFDGIGSVDLIAKNIYQVGDRVLAVASYDAEGSPTFYVTDYVRTRSLWWIAAIFVLSLAVVGRWKGLRSILALILTFLVIIRYIVPRILSGASPLMVTLIGSIAILLIIIYLTEGWCVRSHIAVVSIFFSLVVTIISSWFFVSLAKLTGVTGENVSFLINIGERVINFRGLLLAGIIIGALGVLDDVVISQVATAEQIARANRSLSGIGVFKHAYRVGISHIASMTNTLFLAYAGAALPLLVLFVSGQSAFSGWEQVINNEMIATEIVRTLAGSIGLILSVPIATFIAAWRFGRKGR